MYQTETPKLFISSLLQGKRTPQGGCQSFLQCLFREAVRQEMQDGGWPFRDATPETGFTQIHCLIRLNIQLTLLYHQGQGSNQFNMVANRGQLTQ